MPTKPKKKIPPPLTKSEKARLRWIEITVKAFTWNNFLRLAGVTGIAYQTLAENADRPTLLLLFGAMIGLPSFLPGKEKET